MLPCFILFVLSFLKLFPPIVLVFYTSYFSIFLCFISDFELCFFSFFLIFYLIFLLSILSCFSLLFRFLCLIFSLFICFSVYFYFSLFLWFFIQTSFIQIQFSFSFFSTKQNFQFPTISKRIIFSIFPFFFIEYQTYISLFFYYKSLLHIVPYFNFI